MLHHRHVLQERGEALLWQAGSKARTATDVEANGAVSNANAERGRGAAAALLLPLPGDSLRLDLGDSFMAGWLSLQLLLLLDQRISDSDAQRALFIYTADYTVYMACKCYSMGSCVGRL